MENILVSIITITFNSEKTIEDTFKSVLSQSYNQIEYIVVDGKSNDNTLNIINKYEEKFKDKGILFKLISEKDSGIYDAMNKGIKLAKGKLIGIINSDDWYESEIIEKIVEEYLENDCPNIIHGNLNMYSDEKKFLKQNKPKLNYEKMWQGMIIKHPTCFIEKEVYEDLGLYRDDLKIASDYDFLLRAFINKKSILYLNESITNMRLGGVSDKFLIDSWKEVEKCSISNGLNKNVAKYYFYKKILRRKIMKVFGV